MPPKAPLTSIECYTTFHLNDELASVQDALSTIETEETWDAIATALTRFAALCNGNANNYPTELVAALRASSRPISSALNSERTRLSGTATDFVTTAATALGSAFEPLVPHYFPTLLTLCTRTNKVFVNRAKACIAALVEYTQAPLIIHYAADSIKDKSVSLRLAAAETLMMCMKSYNPPDLERESRAREIEAVIRSTAVDANADVRKVGRRIFDAYKILLPGRMQSFIDPMSPRTRKYLEIKGTVPAPTNRPQPPSRPTSSQPPSRPTSSQSTRSTHSDTRGAPSSYPSTSSTTTAPQRLTRHIRSASTSQSTTTTHPAPPQRPMREPTPEYSVPAPVPTTTTTTTTHDFAPRRPAREEPRRLKVNMPPPDYIPAHTTGPQRPMSASELHVAFPFNQPHTGATSGPQRVIRAEVPPAAVRTGPIRPALFNFKQGSITAEDGERKERVMGGARRVLRVPEPEPQPAPAPHPADEKGKVPAHGAMRPIRPRVISTSRSTPAVVPGRDPLAVAKEVKKLASSMGASSRPAMGATGPTTTVTARAGRTATAATAAASAGTATSRVRNAERDKDREEKEKRVKERREEKERRAKEKAAEQAKEEKRAKEKEERRVREKEQRAKEKSQPAAEQEKERERPQSRTDSKSSATTVQGTAATVTMRDKTNRMHAAKAEATVEKHARKPASKVRAPTPQTEVVALVKEEEKDDVVPTEVPLPETPKVAPVPSQDASLPALIEFSTSTHEIQQEAISVPSEQPEQLPARAPSPSAVLLPNSRPNSDGSITPPSTLLAPAPLVQEMATAAPHTPTPETRPHRRAEVEQTPISALLASIERGFHVPLSPMREEDEDEGESVIVVDESERDGRVFGVGGYVPVRVEPLFSRTGVRA